MEEKQPLVSVASAAGPSIPASVPEPVGGENEHAEVGSEPKRIEKVLSGNTALQRDIALLRRADGTLYESVDFPTAETYADISPRRRQQLMKDDGPLKVVGKGRKRRITVESLIAYCPPAEDAK